MLHRCAPVVVQVVATGDNAHARHAQLVLDSASGTEPGSRTRSLLELEWQLNKIYASSVAGPGGLFAPDEAWCKARWGPTDGDRVIRRAELAAWLAARQCGSGGVYEVHIAFGFGLAGARGQAEVGLAAAVVQAEAVSDLHELIVVDLRRLERSALPPTASPGFAAVLSGGFGSPPRRVLRMARQEQAPGSSEDGSEAGAFCAAGERAEALEATELAEWVRSSGGGNGGPGPNRAAAYDLPSATLRSTAVGLEAP